MTTKTVKAPKVSQNDELAKLRAELEAAKAERDMYAAKVAKREANAKNPRRAAWMADATEADCTAAADTVLGKAQRQPREELCYTIQKVLRLIPNRELPALLASLTEHATKDGGLDGESTADKLLEAAMVRTARGPRKPKEETEA